MQVYKRMTSTLICLALVSAMTACSSVKLPVKHRYKLCQYATDVKASKSSNSILISKTDAINGYQTQQMLYMKHPYELTPFVNNAWVSPPANMIYALLIQSVSKSRYFNIVASNPYSDKTDYRLDTQLIQMQQDFLKSPSRLNLTMKAVVTHADDNRPVASNMFYYSIPCPQNSPLGGVLAANTATQRLTHDITQFAIRAVRGDSR